MKDQVFSLVSNVVVLEAEEGTEPIEEVHGAVAPLDVGRLAEVSDGT